MSFVNDNIKLLNAAKHQTIQAAKISNQEFIDNLKTLITALRIYNSGTDYSDSILSSIFTCAATSILWNIDKSIPYECSEENAIAWWDSKALDELKYNIPFEEKDNVLGLNQSATGVPYLGVLYTSWYGIAEIPFFAAIYYDSDVKAFRTYVPLYGNLINVDCKSSFGYEVNSSRYLDVVEAYKKKGLLDKTFNVDSKTASEEVVKAYLKKQGLKPDELKGSWDAIKQELDLVFA